MPPRTIDNLGVEVSTRYAEDQKWLDEKIIKEARAIPLQTQIDVSLPSFASELDILVQSDRTRYVWATFFPPNKYLEQKGRLFSFLVIPSVGSDEKIEALNQKILAKLRAISEKREAEKGAGKESPDTQFEKKETEEEEKEKKALTLLLETIASLDKFLIDINSRRSQYQKG
jgi:hypothetical protein